MLLLLMLGLDIGLPLSVLTLFLIMKKEKYLWFVPVAFIAINIVYVFNDILSLYVNQPIDERIRLYFANDASMGLYLIHIPMVLFSILLTLCFRLARKHRKR